LINRIQFSSSFFFISAGDDNTIYNRIDAAFIAYTPSSGVNSVLSVIVSLVIP
jgi:hypothetical protein